MTRVSRLPLVCSGGGFNLANSNPAELCLRYTLSPSFFRYIEIQTICVPEFKGEKIWTA